MLNLPIAFGGVPEWTIILLVVLLLFGGRKLPQLARSMGSSITQFKKGLKEEVKDEPEEIEESKDEDA
ncbi:MAG TPA: twin-arginine translocase TatA/TatE family subunit [Planctomycetes bacterium]|nr:twin-arginine translocase TatA/TatE family subunit [Planctomycetota bacterium]HIL37664.1 twin-arginine translocase TatA/TatE family subunit [Planctomycetota bacterium]